MPHVPLRPARLFVPYPRPQVGLPAADLAALESFEDTEPSEPPPSPTKSPAGVGADDAALAAFAEGALLPPGAEEALAVEDASSSHYYRLSACALVATIAAALGTLNW